MIETPKAWRDAYGRTREDNAREARAGPWGKSVADMQSADEPRERAKERKVLRLKERFSAITVGFERAKQRGIKRLVNEYWGPLAGGLAIGAVMFLLATHPQETTLAVRHIAAAPNCDAARAVGLAPAMRGQPGYYPTHDADNDGIACEPWRGR